MDDKKDKQFQSLIKKKPSVFVALSKQKPAKFEPFLPSVAQQIKDYETLRKTDN